MEKKIRLTEYIGEHGERDILLGNSEKLEFHILGFVCLFSFFSFLLSWIKKKSRTKVSHVVCVCVK